MSRTPEASTVFSELKMSNIDSFAPDNITAAAGNANPLFTLLATWVGPEISSSSFGALQPNEAEVIKHFSDTARAVGLASKRRQMIDDEQWEVIKMLLWRLWHIMTFDKELGQKMNIKGILTMFTTPANNFVTPVPEVAEDMKARFESQNWGVPRPIPTIPTRQKSKIKGITKKLTPVHTKDEGYNEGGSGISSQSGISAPLSASSTSVPTKNIWSEAPPDHSIYGLNGCMHHIAQTDSRNYEICCEKGNAAVFGHNGFEVGQCWARQVAAVRDGVHGSRQAGIYGTALEGVYSIIIASTYAELDHDTGDQVLYSVSGALTTTNAEPDITKFTTRAMIRSVNTGTGIRVLRTSGGGWKGSPKAGMRYDGLYRAVAYQVRENKKGGKFLQFQLERMNGQPGIDVDRPTWTEKLTFDRVKDGY
ncbi:PUA-like domain-containing protein [Cadophora sp. MPI-SDFR-AT-0126]|nr:PUA-like domain-containing protein [Leotiomycetes sp. MPI-SDFR-AT-0126]